VCGNIGLEWTVRETSGHASSHNFPLTWARFSSISPRFIHLTPNGTDILRMIQRSETVSVEVAQVLPSIRSDRRSRFRASGRGASNTPYAASFIPSLEDAIG
jgi:hypothetical protein